jgi:hypothetical protein
MGAELTGSLTARILRERRTATVVLPPATIRTSTSTGVGSTGVGTGPGGATTLVHDAM